MRNKLCQLCAAFLLLFSCEFFAVGQELTTEENQESKASPQERTVYIPFSKLKDVFEKEGRGVFLPYDQFRKLWDEAHRNESKVPQTKSPLDAVITSALNEATVQQDVVQVEATLSIDLIKEGWIQVPLRLKDAAILSATIDGQNARVTPAEDGGYQLLIENTGKESNSIELKLVYSRSFAKSPGRNSVAFDSPQSPVNRWRIRIPQEGVKVNVQPMIAASEADDSVDLGPDNESDEVKASSKADETVLLAFVGAAPQVAIDWTPKSEGALGMTALTAVQVQQEMFVTEGTVRTRANLRYDISRGELSQLSVQVPGDQKIVNVFDANVRKWSVLEEGESQRILVELFEPATSQQTLLIELEQFTDLAKSATINAPRIRAEEVGRQQGTILVNVDPSLKAESTSRVGLMQVDTSEFPAAQSGQTWAFAYRYASLPYEMAIAVEKIQPKITVKQLVEAYLEPESWHLDLLALYQIEDAGIFELGFSIPQGFEVLQVREREWPDATTAAIDAFHVEGESKEKLIVNLSRKAIGKVAIHIQLRKRVSDANLLSPTGAASELRLGLPQVDQLDVIRSEGHLILHSPDSLRINPSTMTHLRPVAFSEAYQSLASVRDNRFPSTQPVLAFAFGEQKPELALNAERRKSYITARQRMVVRCESGVVRYETRIAYEILYSGVKSLRIDVPASIAGEIRNTSSGLRETPITPAPSDVPEGYVAWELIGETELLGQKIVQFTWERKLDQLDVGKSVALEVPHLKPMNADRAWGQIVVTKAESIDVQPSGEPTGLRAIDPAHDVMADAIVADASRAFEFYDDWSLKLTATRFQLEEVKRTSIERALVRAVVTRSNQLGVQSLYRMRSARQRLALELPVDAEFDSQPARINGQPVPLERGEQGQLFIPLVGQEPNTPFQLELRYSMPGNQSRLSVPAFPEDPAIQKVFFAVHLPVEQSLLGSSGPWTEEFTWGHKDAFRSTPNAKQSEQELLQWVTEGVASSQPTLFQTDGAMYLFSALRPQPPPEGNLQLRVMNEKWLALIVFASLATLAFALLRRPMKAKIAALAVLMISLILCGTFMPTFAHQVFNSPLYLGLLIVGVVWSAWYLSYGLRSVDWDRFGRKRSSSPTIATEAALSSPEGSSETKGDATHE